MTEIFTPPPEPIEADTPDMLLAEMSRLIERLIRMKARTEHTYETYHVGSAVTYARKSELMLRVLVEARKMRC